MKLQIYNLQRSQKSVFSIESGSLVTVLLHIAEYKIFASRICSVFKYLIPHNSAVKYETSCYATRKHVCLIESNLFTEFAKSSKAVATSFCNDISWEGSLAYLNNALTPQDATRCICTVTVPQTVNLDVKRLYNDGNCASFVNMVDEEDKPTDFCLAGELQCKDGGRQLHFEYIPSGQTVSYLSISGQYKLQWTLSCHPILIELPFVCMRAH